MEPLLRVYLSGRVALEGPSGRIEGRAFPGRQGRELFCFLVVRRGAPTSRSDVASALWGHARPASWESALSAIVSKLRSQVAHTGLDGPATFQSGDGCYRLTLPAGTWIDQEVAAECLHQAESALREGDVRGAYGPSAVAWAITRRPFLPGSDAQWIDRHREKLRGARIRALECRSSIYLQNGEFALAVEAAHEATVMEPFRESAYRHLMNAHAAAGNAAEALRVYERCRELLSEELGIPPSEETKRAYVAILQAL